MEISRPRKIFIVDDDEMLTEALSDYLTRKTAHEIRVFHTGEDFVKHISEKPEVVILDYYLNSIKSDAANGLEILESVRKQLKETQIIMLSSQESYIKAARTIQKGAEQYIIKDENAFQKIAEAIHQ